MILSLVNVAKKKYIPMGDNRPGSITEVDKNGRPIEFEI